MKILLFVLSFLFTASSYAANITQHESGKGCTLSGAFIEGEIQTGDFKKFQSVISNLKKKYGDKECTSGNTHIRINSSGGNVDEALLIGREIRKNSLGVIILEKSQCLSSCVFILASGVSKLVMGTVGIHRPYFSFIEDGKSADEVRSMREALNQRIKSFLNYVDVPESLLDEMLAYPPEKIKLLAEQDLIKFRLNGKDATQDEIDTANSAKFFNLTSAEYRKRFEDSFSKCSHLFSTNSSGEQTIKCLHSLILKIPESEYDRRINKVNAMCSSVGVNEKLKCKKRYLVDNN